MSLNVEATGFEPATPRPPAECAKDLKALKRTLEAELILYVLIESNNSRTNDQEDSCYCLIERYIIKSIKYNKISIKGGVYLLN